MEENHKSYFLEMTCLIISFRLTLTGQEFADQSCRAMIQLCESSKRNFDLMPYVFIEIREAHAERKRERKGEGEGEGERERERERERSLRTISKTATKASDS